MKRILVIVLASFSLPLFDLINFKISCVYTDDGPTYYGFPAIYRTNITWPNSFSGEFFISGYLIDALFWFVVIAMVSYLLNKIKLKERLIIQIGKISIWIFIILFSGKIAIDMLYIDYRFKWKVDYSLDGYYQNSECHKEIIFFDGR